MNKPYGIRITLPPDDSMSLGHLLGKNWESFRWFENQALRDRIFDQMKSQPGNYREGDRVTIELGKINP